LPRHLPRRVGGIGFVAAFVAGVVAYGNGAGSSNAEISAYYANHGNQVHQIVGFALIAVAVVLFVVFVAGLQDVLAPDRSVVAFVSGGCSRSSSFSRGSLSPPCWIRADLH
jgi:ATP-dependent protease HslVU (ClpYQ) peptidase subunit